MRVERQYFGLAQRGWKPSQNNVGHKIRCCGYADLIVGSFKAGQLNWPISGSLTFQEGQRLSRELGRFQIHVLPVRRAASGRIPRKVPEGADYARTNVVRLL